LIQYYYIITNLRLTLWV